MRLRVCRATASAALAASLMAISVAASIVLAAPAQAADKAAATCTDGDRGSAKAVADTKTFVEFRDPANASPDIDVVLRYSEQYQCAWGLIGGVPGDRVWIDRWVSAAPTWEPKLGDRPIQSGNGTTYTAAVRTGGAAARACGQEKANGAIECTAWEPNDPLSVPSPKPGRQMTSEELASEIIDNPNIDKTQRLVLDDLQRAARGALGTAGVMTSRNVLGMISWLGRFHSLQISAIQSGGTGHCLRNGVPTPKAQCPGNAHYNGRAFDISRLDGHALSGRDAFSQVAVNEISGSLPPASGLGESLCAKNAPFKLPPGVTEFPDSCDHLHVQVPA